MSHFQTRHQKDNPPTRFAACARIVFHPSVPVHALRFRKISVGLLCGLSICLATKAGFAQSSNAETEVKLADGKTIEASQVLIENGAVVVVDAAGNLSPAKPFEQINKIQFRTTAESLSVPNFSIGLRDGSTISANQLSIIDGVVNMRMVDEAVLESSLREITWIKLRSDSTIDGKQWNRVLEEDARTSDAIIVLREGELEAIEGVVGDLAEGRIDFTIGGRTANVELAKISGITFFAIAAENPLLPVCQVHLLDGSVLFAREILMSANRLAMKTVSGVEVEVSPSSLSMIDFSMGRALYLDDLKPATNDWRPLLASDSTVPALRALNVAKAKQSYSNEPLALLFPVDGFTIAPQSVQFEHGFAMRSGGRLSFKLDDEYSTLNGFVGFDPKANRNGSTLLTVRAGGKLLLQERLENKMMDRPLKLDLDINGAKRIVFELSYHDGRSVGDQVHLVDLKVSK